MKWSGMERIAIVVTAVGLVIAVAWPFFHENRAFDFFDHLLPLNAPAGTQARMSIGGTFELEN